VRLAEQPDVVGQRLEVRLLGRRQVAVGLQQDGQLGPGVEPEQRLVVRVGPERGQRLPGTGR
jgi:hypothetical protein